MAFEDYDKVYNNKNVKTNIFYVSLKRNKCAEIEIT